MLLCVDAPSVSAAFDCWTIDIEVSLTGRMFVLTSAICTQDCRVLYRNVCASEPEPDLFYDETYGR